MITAGPSLPTLPLVSVIIPCCNHGVYLTEAFRSIWHQDYPATEILVVDDGSSDNTREVVAAYPDVRYIHQANRGLSSARNTGIASAKGEFLVFLDADDWLLPGALSTNAGYLLQNHALAFVSGGHKKVFVAEGRVETETREVPSDHYVHLLRGNYIGMHAAVMYRKSVFDQYSYDPMLKACEDYDLYLRVARHHLVGHHTGLMAAYRLHDSNMSGNISLMLSTVLTVLERQQPFLQTPSEKEAYAFGQQNWSAYYGSRMAKQSNGWAPKGYQMMLNPQQFIKSALVNSAHPKVDMIKNLLKRYTPDFGLKLMHKARFYQGYVPPVGKVAAGDFARSTPFSTKFGYDRGGPIDRYYIENFLRNEASSITGRVLEIGDNSYTLEFGGKNVAQSDILHVDVTNPNATFIGDLSEAPQVPDNTFDCLILTQTLHLIYDFKGALTTCYRILKPGGTLLLTAPGITPIDREEWEETWYWAFTDKALRRLMADTFPSSSIEVSSFGNVHVAAAFLYGMGLPEISPEVLDHHDPQFQVINAVKAVKRK